MSADKRSVTTDALTTLGTIIGPGEKRDAIHLAVEPVVAGESLAPGDHIDVKDGVATSTDVGAGLGIVDPFLTKRVKKGERFWFVMYPRMVHSLRHVWTHPSFPDSDGVVAPPPLVHTAKDQAERWLRDYAAAIGVGFDKLVSSARDWIEHEEYLCQGGDLEGLYTSDEFWTHYATYTGDDVPKDKRENFFTCSC